MDPQATAPSAPAASVGLRRFLVLLGGVGLLAIVVQAGFVVSPLQRITLINLQLIGGLALWIAQLMRWLNAPSRRAELRRSWFEHLTALVLLIAFVTMLVVSGMAQALHVVRLYIAVQIALRVVNVNEQLTGSVRPGLLLVGGFVALIGAGTGLLLLPKCHVRQWSLIDTIFMATSAACVTGLSVRDISSDLTRTGQTVILGLIQVGGLGPMVLALLLSYVQRRRLTLRQAGLVKEMVGTPSYGQLGQTLFYILAITLFCELIGALILVRLRSDLPLADALWWGGFHAVSAFCNAGFALHTDNLVGSARSPGVLGTIGVLIVIGGLGYPLLMELLRFELLNAPLLRRLRYWAGGNGPRLQAGGVSRLSLHTRLVLWSTALLLLLGTVFFFACERGHALREFDFSAALSNALFHSISARTAGFNAVDFGHLQHVTLVVLMVFMAIGASPGSTGGGVKTTTLAVLFLTVRSMMRGRDHIECFGRAIPRSVLQSCVTVAAMYASAVVLVVTLLAVTHPHLEFSALLFETVSALSTVGLSTGVTAELNDAGKLILCAAMLCGRVGPLSIVWFVLTKPPARRYQYPEESVIVS